MRNYLFAVLIVPLDQASWTVLSYKDLPNHGISYSDGLTISVESSAGPLIHKFEKPLRIISIEITAMFSGLIKGAAKLGAAGSDDFPLRIGLIIAGKKRLSFMQSLIAPEWVKKLYAMAPKGVGIEQIYFFNYIPDGSEAAFTKRTHPSSELIVEQVVGRFNNGKVEQRIEIEHSDLVLGIWLSVDGDDTKSRFETSIKAISVEAKN